MTGVKEQIEAIGAAARRASRDLATMTSGQKNAILSGMADALEQQVGAILAENGQDVALASEHGLSTAAIDRLRLTEKRVLDMAKDVRDVAALHDPVGEVIRDWTRPNGIRISKVRTPIGVIGIIYESRPNVTCDAAVLCIKTGNAVVLRGGSEALHSNLAIARALQEGGAAGGLPTDAVQLIPTRDREAVKFMAAMDRFIDVIVPRGGHQLIETVMAHARMPVIKHYHGVCSVYVDADADLARAVKIVVNAKCQRPGVCNAMETLLVHRAIARDFFAELAPEFTARGVKIHADPEALDILNGIGFSPLTPATQESWTTEYLDLIASVGVVEDVDAAIDHIERFGSHHSDAIVTENAATAEHFLQRVDSATVFWNASTRFNDGGEFGFGAEIGISTDKLHARGPMGLEELTTYKYLIRGSGQIRE